MKKEINIKNIIFYTAVIVITVIAITFVSEPEVKEKPGKISKFIEKITVAQKIAPQRMFVNVWRITKNEYADETLNSQDWSKWKFRYLKYIKTQEDSEIAINSMLASLNDPYTKFLKPGTYLKQKSILDSKISGIGVIFNKSEEKITINNVLKDSPAQNAQILPGDVVLSINGKNTDNQDIKETIKNIEDGKTDKVILTIKRDDKLIKKELKKQDIYFKTMAYNILKNNIAIIRLSNIMGEKAVEDFKNIIIKTNDCDAIIIDLRNNYGGILINAVEMANLMLEPGKMLSIKSRVNSDYQIFSDEENVFKSKPVIILINGYTASSAEIFAGILKDNINAILIGENSFGKNSIQQIIPLHNDSGLILTTDKYILPSGEDINHKGLTPDIIIRQNGYETPNKDRQLKKAISLASEIVKNKE